MILNGLPWKQTRDHSVVFEIASRYCISDSSVDHDGYSFSSEGFLPAVVDIMVIWVKFTPFQSILVCWFLECRRSPLPSPVWPLPICLDSWTWHSRFLCNIALYTIRPYFYYQSHPQLGIVLLWLHPFILSGVISLLISSSILDTYWSGEFLFQYPIILPFHTVMGFSRQEYWSGLPFPSPVDRILSDLSTMTQQS